MSGKIMGKVKRMMIVSAILFAVTGIAVFITYGDSSNAADNEQIIFSAESGCYDSEFQLSLEAPGGGDIYYTLDGSVPSPGKSRTVKYTGAFTVSDNKGSASVLATEEYAEEYVDSGRANVPQPYDLDRASIVRAVVVADDGTVSPVSTRTYFVNNDILEKYNGCAVMSIVTDPDNLIGWENGIYIKGSRFDASSKTDGDLWLANFMQSGREWERSANMEFFDGSRTASISRGVGIRIHGGYSRRNQQKSFNIYFRSDYDYGIKNLSGYDLIPGATVTYDGSLAEGETRATSKYGNVMIRNGGNDVDITKFQDVFIQGRVTDRKFTTQASRPCVLYLNGEYWGLYNLTEKYGDKYLAEEFDVDKDNVIVYKDLNIDEGAALDPQGDELNNLMGLGNLDMTKQENYNRFLETVDVDSYIDYYATEIYINNNDWWSGCNAGTPHNNLMFWKVADSALESADNPYADGRWRYMLFDTEWSMGIYYSTQAGAEYDSIKYHAMGEPDPYNDTDAGRTEANGDPVFRALFKNSEFRKQFTNTLLDIRNWNFEYERCEKEIDRLTDIYSPLMENNRERWGTGDIWGGVNAMKNFLRKRPEYVLKMLEDNIDELDINDRVNLTVSNSAKKAYAVGVNTIVSDSSKGFEGVYYKDYPITVTAKDIDGYTFDHWDVSGVTVSAVNEAEAVVTFTDSYARINAVYTKDGGPGTEDNNGYIAEFAVPFKDRKNSGDKVSLELQIADCISEADKRIGKLNLFADSSPFSDRSQFGLVTLCDNYEGSGFEADSREMYAVRTDEAIIADGNIEDVWQKAVPVVIEKYTPKEVDGMLYEQSIAATARIMWDSDNMYVLVKVVDNDLKTNDSLTESDCVELFFDESVDEDTLNSKNYTTAFQYRISYDGTAEPGNNYENSGYSVIAAANIAEKEVPVPTPTPSPTKEPAQTDDKFTAAFVAENASVTTYLRQNYSAADETFTNQNTAVARSSDTGDIDISGNGQINFTVVPKDGYSVESVSVSPQGNYKNIKPPVETGKDNTYRVTKITGDITITITTKSAGQTGDNKNEFTATFDAGPNCSITTYDTQDYDNTSVTHVNQTSAVARDSVTGEIDVSGNGQVSFTVVPDAGYIVKEVAVSPKNYKNIKTPEDTGRANTYRVTKIIGDVIVKVTLEASGEPVKTNPPVITESPVKTDSPDSTKEPDVTEKPDVTKEPDTTKQPDVTENPDVTKEPDATKEPDITDKPDVTKSPDVTDKPQVTDVPGDGNPSGKEFTSGYLKYIISGKTAIVTGVVKKTVKAVNIPASVKWNGVSYKVSKVSDKALKNCKKLKNVIIGKNIKTIGKHAFRGCSRLSKIIIKSKGIKKIGKAAFTKTSKKIKLYIPKSKYARYVKKVFKGKGLSASARYFKK